jgi:type VI secretion system protein ImpM
MVLGLGTSTTVGLFGKTPTQADFVRFNAGSSAARAWDEWMNASLGELRRSGGTEWESKFDSAPALRFVGRPSGDPRQIVAGRISPSHDQSGRRYPLTVFCELQLDRQGRGIQVLPYALESFLDSAKLLADACSTRTPDGSVIRAMSTLVPENPVELARGMADHLREVTMESFWSALFGSFDDPRKYLCIKNLFGILAPLRGHDPRRLAMGLRFPGTSGNSTPAPSFVMSVWASLCRAVVGEESLAVAWIFWHDAPGTIKPGCYLYFRPPTSGALGAMFAPALTIDSIWDIESMGVERISEARDALGPAITSVLETPRFAVLEFIQRI